MDLISGIAIGSATLILLLAGVVVVGFVTLFRRRGSALGGALGGRRLPGSTSGSFAAITRRAGALLVRLDNALRESDDELGFAIAQFGADASRPYATALAEARAKVTEAFRLRQALDDSVADSEREQRDWTLQIIALCEQADAVLAQQNDEFTQLRTREVNAASTLDDVRRRIAALSARVKDANTTLEALSGEYAASTFATVAANPAQAETLVATASQSADAAAPGISQAGVSAVSSTLSDALQAVHRADQLLDAVDRTARDLAAATAAASVLRDKTKADLVEAAAQLSDAPDAASGQAIIDAIAAVEAAVANTDRTNPVADLDRIGDSVAGLDLALAGARNQKQRLEHARAAYAGTLVSASSQISVARDIIGSRGGNVNARTRLAEAERQLMLAQAAAASDPVEALDAVRRAVMHAQDADALARY